MSDIDYDERVECQGQTRLDLPDAGPVDESCSLCMGGGSCPQCGGDGTTGRWDEERLAENADLRRAIEAAVEKLREAAAVYPAHTTAGGCLRVVALDLERAIGVPW